MHRLPVCATAGLNGLRNPNPIFGMALCHILCPSASSATRSTLPYLTSSCFPNVMSAGYAAMCVSFQIVMIHVDRNILDIEILSRCTNQSPPPKLSLLNPLKKRTNILFGNFPNKSKLIRIYVYFSKNGNFSSLRTPSSDTVVAFMVENFVNDAKFPASYC